MLFFMMLLNFSMKFDQKSLVYHLGLLTPKMLIWPIREDRFFFHNTKAFLKQVVSRLVEAFPPKGPSSQAYVSCSKGIRDQSGLASSVRSPSTTPSGGSPPFQSSACQACPCSKVHAKASWAATASSEVHLCK